MVIIKPSPWRSDGKYADFLINSFECSDSLEGDCMVLNFRDAYEFDLQNHKNEVDVEFINDYK